MVLAETHLEGTEEGTYVCQSRSHGDVWLVVGVRIVDCRAVDYVGLEFGGCVL